jgi:hypothetical protein
MLGDEPCWGSDHALQAKFGCREGVDEHTRQGEEHGGLHLGQPPHPELVEAEVALEPGEDAFDALPLPHQPPIHRRPPLDDRVEPQPLRQGLWLPVSLVGERDDGGGAPLMGRQVVRRCVVVAVQLASMSSMK